MEKQPKVELNRDINLENIKPKDYINLGKSFSEWLEIQEDLPARFWEKVKDANNEENLKLVLLRILEELFEIYGNKRDKGKSFSDSRFTSLDKMIERGMVSCGAMTKIFGTTLRRLGFPVKFIHGIFESQKGFKEKILKNRHSWLKIYNPNNKEWQAIDPTRSNFMLQSDAEEIKEYHDWDELKIDYDKGKF